MKIVLAMVLTFIIFCDSIANQKTDSKPNIILICADDLGWSDIGCYGSEIQTPNLDELGEGGMRFRNFHNEAKCVPSRASLLTGIYGQKVKVTDPQNMVTLGEVLQSVGYRTLFSGKNQLFGGENPVFRGFDRYYGLNSGASNHFNPGMQRMGDGPPARKDFARPWCFDSVTLRPYTPIEKNFYSTDYFTNYALDFLDEYKEEDKPFFLYLAYTAPHEPLQAWPEDIAKYEGKYDKGYETIRQKRYEKQLNLGLINEKYKLSEASYKNWNEIDAPKQNVEKRKMSVYAAMIDRMDQNIGRILTKLKESGKADNTIIIFLSDNGASAEDASCLSVSNYGEIGSLTRWTALGESWANVCNTPFKNYKRYSHEGGINTPLIVYWPGHINANTFSDFPGHFIDIMPTLAEITGAKYPETVNNQSIIPMQGQSLLPVFMGEKIERKEPLYWKYGFGQAVQYNSWKAVKYGYNKYTWELYNLEKDPVETNNLAERNHNKLKELETLFNKWESGLFSN